MRDVTKERKVSGKQQHSGEGFTCINNVATLQSYHCSRSWKIKDWIWMRPKVRSRNPEKKSWSRERWVFIGLSWHCIVVACHCLISVYLAYGVDLIQHDLWSKVKLSTNICEEYKGFRVWLAYILKTVHWSVLVIQFHIYLCLSACLA